MSDMEGLNHIAKIRSYCDYVEEHLLNVAKAWKILQGALGNNWPMWDDYLFWTIDGLIREHDVSKMSNEEFIPYQQKFFPVEGRAAGCDCLPFDDGIPVATDFGPAWEHHKANNPHHWETWTTIPAGVPNEHACHLVCMVCDWMAMGMKFGDTAEEFYEANKKRIILPDWAVDFLRGIFAALRDTTEERRAHENRKE